MRLPVRLKTRLDTRLPVRMGARIETRWFRMNEGSSDYISISIIVLSPGDTIELSYLAYAGNPPANVFFFDRAVGTGGRAALLFNSNGFVNNYPVWASSRSDDGVDTPISGLIPLDSKLHSIKMTVDGSSAGKVISGLMISESGGGGFNGVMFDFKHRSSNGTLLRHYPINDNNSTIIDTVSGQNGTVVNGNTDDWGLFEKLPNGNWRGINLSSLWDSPNQILEVA